MYICIHIYIHTYIHICIYTYITEFDVQFLHVKFIVLRLAMSQDSHYDYTAPDCIFPYISLIILYIFVYFTY